MRQVCTSVIVISHLVDNVETGFCQPDFFSFSILVLLVNYLCSLFILLSWNMQHFLCILSKTRPILILKSFCFVSDLLVERGCWVDRCLLLVWQLLQMPSEQAWGPKAWTRWSVKNFGFRLTSLSSWVINMLSKASAFLFVSDPGWERWRDHHQRWCHHPEADAGAPPCSQNGTFMFWMQNF